MKRILMIGTGGTIASGKTAEGLMPELTTEQLLAFVPPIWAVNLLVSSLWLRRFRQGPVEWLWRQLTLRASGTSLKDTSR